MILNFIQIYKHYFLKHDLKFCVKKGFACIQKRSLVLRSRELCNIAITMFPERTCRRFVHVNHCMIKFLLDSTRKRCNWEEQTTRLAIWSLIQLAQHRHGDATRAANSLRAQQSHTHFTAQHISPPYKSACTKYKSLALLMWRWKLTKHPLQFNKLYIYPQKPRSMLYQNWMK